MTAKTHGLAEEAERLREKMNLKNQQQKKTQLQQQSADPESVPDVPLEDLAPKVQGHPNAKCLLPPVPILTEVGNWPQLTISRGPFDVGLHQYLSEQKRAVAGAASDVVASSAKTLAALGAAAAAAEEDLGEEGWVEDEPVATESVQEEAEPEEANEWDVDLDIPKPAPKPKAAAAVQQVSLPRDGPSWPQLWCLNSDVPADHVAAGNFESAMQLLNAQIGACQFQSMKPHFMRLFTGARARSMLSPGTPAVDSYLLRNPEVLAQPQGLREAVPALALTVNELIEKLHAGYRATTAGKFQEAMEMFKYIFSALPLVCAQTSQELNDAKDLIQICTDYIVGLMTELKRKEVLASNKTQAGAIRVAELAAYFTHCNLQPVHLQLTLRSAMNIAIKLRNFATAYNMGRRLLDLNPKPDVAEKTQQALEVCEQGGLKDEAPMGEYDERNPFVVVKGTGLVIVRRRQPARGAPQQSRTSNQRPAEDDEDF
jgi:coatomer subunit alpha